MAPGEALIEDTIDQFHRLRTSTKMNVAMERQALIAALILPITAMAPSTG
jgi:hypothetical protein